MTDWGKAVRKFDGVDEAEPCSLLARFDEMAETLASGG